jgi:fucose permease
LELFKDLPIAMVSFLVASLLPRMGYKNSMLLGLALTIVGAAIMYLGRSFLAAKLLMLCVGAGFAFAKVSVYASVGLVTEGEKAHNSLMSNVEGVFMLGIASAYFLFPAFQTDAPDSWLNIYLFLGGLSAVAILFIQRTLRFPEGQLASLQDAPDLGGMLKMMALPLVLVFVASAFFFVMVEQGIMTWLPTFNNDVLHLDEAQSIYMASILAISLGLGRFAAGWAVRYLRWSSLLLICLTLAMLMVVFVLPFAVVAKAQAEWPLVLGVPLAAFLFPLIGLFIAPVYPLLASTVLSVIPKAEQAAMTGLIIVFSALGGTLGSRIIAYFFEREGGGAFYFTLLPMVLLMLGIVLLRRMTARA